MSRLSEYDYLKVNNKLIIRVSSLVNTYRGIVCDNLVNEENQNPTVCSLKLGGFTLPRHCLLKPGHA